MQTFLIKDVSVMQMRGPRDIVKCCVASYV